MTAPVVAILSALLVHATAAGQAVSPKITDVAIGLPLPRSKCIRVHWDGEAAPAHFPNRRSLNGWYVAHRVGVSAWWPVPDATEKAGENRIAEMATFTHEMRTRVLGDSTLGGVATDLVMEDAEPDFQQVGGTLYAVVPITFLTDATDYALAP